MKHNLMVSDYGAQAMATLSDQGLAIPRQLDAQMPVLPFDITQVDDEELMGLFTSFTSFLDFVSYQVALAEIEERAMERKLDAAIALATSNQPKGLAAVIKATALADPKVVELAEAHSVAYNYRKLIQTMSENLSRDITLVSRELTRRTSDGATMVRARRFSP